MIDGAAAIVSEHRRRAAMLDGDADALRGLMHPDGVYIHSSGFVDRASALVDGIAAGRLSYERLEVDQESVTAFEQTAVIVYRQISVVQISGVASRSHTRCAAIWSADDAHGLRLVSFQSAPLAEP